MTEKKTGAKSAPKSKATTKAAQSPAKAKKPRKPATGKATKAKKAKPEPAEKAPQAPKVPGWLKKSPTEHIISTEDYRRCVVFHNEKFGTHYNPWRVQPQVFMTIHQRLIEYFNDESGGA